MAAENPAPAQPEPPSPAPRRATKFMADLTRAMQAAAEAARNETMTRFDADAKAFVDEIRSGTTSDVADLRRKADDDMASIREKSKAEIARIREETEARVAERKTGLEAGNGGPRRHEEARAERVAAVVAAFEAEMADFFERLNAEEDPTRIATMAETMPDPPSLEEVVSSIVDQQHPRRPSQSPPWQSPLTYLREPSPDQREPPPNPTRAAVPLAEDEIDFAAAEAEAASFDGDLKELGDEDEVQAPPAAATAETSGNRRGGAS